MPTCTSPSRRLGTGEDRQQQQQSHHLCRCEPLHGEQAGERRQQRQPAVLGCRRDHRNRPVRHARAGRGKSLEHRGVRTHVPAARATARRAKAGAAPAGRPAGRRWPPAAGAATAAKLGRNAPRAASVTRRPMAASSSSSSGNGRLPALYSGASNSRRANDQKNVEPAGSTFSSTVRVSMAVSSG